MNTKELMIGDWVRIKHDDTTLYMQVEQVMNSCIGYHYGWDVITPDFNAEPIPLTAEILKANGFVYDGKYEDYSLLYKMSYTIYIGHDLDTISVNKYIDTPDGREVGNILSMSHNIPYVHELQHVLRLCGLSEMADNFKVDAK